MAIIEVSNLSKIYTAPIARKQKRAVDNISFTVEEGQIFGFLGPNGSGKTTTIGMLLDIIRRTEGEIALFGSTSLNAARKRMGATLETPNFYPYLSGYDNLKIVAYIKDIREERIQETLRTVGLDLRQKDKFKAYSLGMKQRLALASALLSDPELIILDEPANGLDPEGIREIRTIIKHLAASGKTIFLSSHLLDEVEQTCTHVAVIKNGALLAQGSMQELTNRNAMYSLRAEGIDLATLKQAVERFPEALSVSIKNGSIHTALRTQNAAALNRFLAGEGVYLSHLSESRQSLEEVFLEITQ
jgi:ABC-type multidrug transport system ATPase subunit